ncbi:MAG: hypothetical protein JXA78_14560 [Anaerolineales bacterium]|nr:hypothetical protein [Anaerolineales bacterium]
MVEIHLYGNLRRLALDSRLTGESTIRLDINGGDTVEAVLDRVGVHTDQISTIFVNSKLFVTRNTMAKWLGYVQLGDDPLAWDLSFALKDGDRIGLFGRDMPALVV